VFYDYVTSSLHTLVNSTEHVELPTHRQPQIRIKVHNIYNNDTHLQ
jgi:hypothetical protein